MRVCCFVLLFSKGIYVIWWFSEGHPNLYLVKELKSKQVNEANCFPKWKVFILCMNGCRMRIWNRMVQNRIAQQCLPRGNRQAELGSAVQETRALLKPVQWRATEMFSGLQHLTWEQWLRERGLLSQGESRLRRISAMCINWVKMGKPDMAMGKVKYRKFH